MRPWNGSVSGDTLLTIDGVNLGQSYDEIREGITVKLSNGESVPCVLDEAQTHDPTRLTCRLQPAPHPGSGNVHVVVRGSHSQTKMTESRQTFTFYVSVTDVVF